MVGFVIGKGEISELKRSAWTLGHSLLVYALLVACLVALSAVQVGWRSTMLGLLAVCVSCSLGVFVIVWREERQHE